MIDTCVKWVSLIIFIAILHISGVNVLIIGSIGLVMLALRSVVERIERDYDDD